ncbi:unnamed protein product [Amoebophrya sp. A120]|nr:unnamed protein product [Amoebophrya sp. A120]|eukprot:GSA120T00022849001.1
MNLMGLPTCERARIYWRYEHERKALAVALRKALARSEIECRRFLLRSLSFVQLPKPRMREMLLQAVRVARRASLKNVQPREPNYSTFRHDSQGILSSTMPPVSNQFLFQQLTRLRSFCKRKKATVTPQWLSKEQEGCLVGFGKDSQAFRRFVQECPPPDHVPVTDDKSRDNFYTLPRCEFLNILVLAARSDMVPEPRPTSVVLAEINKQLTSLPIPLKPITSLPYFYPSLKNKCIKDGQLVCTKTIDSGHNHWRKIVSMITAIKGPNRLRLRKLNWEVSAFIQKRFKHHNECNDLSKAKDELLQMFAEMKAEAKKQGKAYRPDVCICCGKPKSLVSMTCEDATSFFEKIPHESFFERCDDLEELTEGDKVARFKNKTPKQVIDTLRGVVPALRYFQVGSDTVYALPPGVGSPIGGINSKVVASVTLCGDEHRAYLSPSPLLVGDITRRKRYVDDCFGISFTLCEECLSQNTRSVYSVPFENVERSSVAVTWLDMRNEVINAHCLEAVELRVSNSMQKQRVPYNSEDLSYARACYTATVQRLINTNSETSVLVEQLTVTNFKWVQRFQASTLRQYLYAAPTLSKNPAVKVSLQVLKFIEMGGPNENTGKQPWRNNNNYGKGNKLTFDEFEEMQDRYNWKQHQKKEADRKWFEAQEQCLVKCTEMIRTGIRGECDHPTTNSAPTTTTSTTATAPASGLTQQEREDIAALKADVKDLKTFRTDVDRRFDTVNRRFDNSDDLLRQVLENQQAQMRANNIPINPKNNNNNNMNNQNGPANNSMNNNHQVPQNFNIAPDEFRQHEDDTCDKEKLSRYMTISMINRISWKDDDEPAVDKMAELTMPELRCIYALVPQGDADACEQRRIDNGHPQAETWRMHIKAEAIDFISSIYILEDSF